MKSAQLAHYFNDNDAYVNLGKLHRVNTVSDAKEPKSFNPLSCQELCIPTYKAILSKNRI